MRPRSITITRSACPNTTSMSCSVKSTATCDRARGRRPPPSACRGRAAPCPRWARPSAGASGCREGEGELDALHVAVGQRAEWRSASGPMPARESRASTCAPRAPAPRPASVLPGRPRARRVPARRSRAPSSRRTSRRPGTCDRPPRARSPAADRPVMSTPASVTVPSSGTSWPLMQLKQVVFPRHWVRSVPRAPRRRRRTTRAHGVDAVERLHQPSTASTGALTREPCATGDRTRHRCRAGTAARGAGSARRPPRANSRYRERARPASR